MGRDRAVELGVRHKDLRQKDLRQKDLRRKDLQGLHHGTRYDTPSYIPRSSHLQSSPPSVQQVTLAVLAYQLAQFKQFPIRLSLSVIRYPYLWLGVTWAMLVLVGSVAAVTLLRIEPGRIEPAELEPAIVAAPPEQIVSAQSQDEGQNNPSQAHQAELPNQPSVSRRDQKSGLPLFALGTVAFSCAIGCLLLSYRLTSHQPKPQSKLPAHPQRLPRPPAPTLTQGTREQGTIRQGTSRTVESTVKKVRSNSSDAPTGATVAIVSPDESHPLDWDEPSLADHLDIRQRRPLSHWL